MADVTTPTRVVDDARMLLRTMRDERAAGRRPYARDVRRLVERSLAFRFSEYVQFLEKYGFITLDRRTDELGATRSGEALLAGVQKSMDGLADDARYHFGDRLVDAPEPERPRGTGVQLDDRYLQLQSIGRGGLGRVWQGVLLSIDRPVAIKMLGNLDEVFRPDQRDEAISLVQDAVRTQARLNSPFIVRILDQNPQHDPPYIVMELAEGGSLRRLVEQGPLEPALAVRYFIQIALGLQAAHAAGVVHRDLKPENIVLDQLGNARIADFGLTRVAQRGGARKRRTYVGYGSVGYMAPELFRGVDNAAPSADVYALGIILYEMLTGDVPGRRSPLPGRLVPELPAVLDEVFDRMARDDLDQRMETIGEALELLYGSPEVLALLDPRAAPTFAAAPTALPGLPDGEWPQPRPSTVAPAPTAPPAEPEAPVEPPPTVETRRPILQVSAALPSEASGPASPGPAPAGEDATIDAGSVLQGEPSADAAPDSSGERSAPLTEALLGSTFGASELVDETMPPYEVGRAGASAEATPPVDEPSTDAGIEPAGWGLLGQLSADGEPPTMAGVAPEPTDPFAHLAAAEAAADRTGLIDIPDIEALASTSQARAGAAEQAPATPAGDVDYEALARQMASADGPTPGESAELAEPSRGRPRPAPRPAAPRPRASLARSGPVDVGGLRGRPASSFSRPSLQKRLPPRDRRAMPRAPDPRPSEPVIEPRPVSIPTPDSIPRALPEDETELERTQALKPVDLAPDPFSVLGPRRHPEPPRPGRQPSPPRPGALSPTETADEPDDEVLQSADLDMIDDSGVLEPIPEIISEVRAVPRVVAATPVAVAVAVPVTAEPARFGADGDISLIELSEDAFEMIDDEELVELPEDQFRTVIHGRRKKGDNADRLRALEERLERLRRDRDQR